MPHSDSVTSHALAPPRRWLQPLVLGPDLIPVITDPEQAASHPELATMSVMAHGQNRAVVDCFMAALSQVKPDHAPQYYEHAYSMASAAVRRVLEEIMSSTTWPVHSPFAREHYGKGLADGKALGEATALLRILDSRHIEMPESARQRILSCADTAVLDSWLDRASTIKAIDELFA